MSNPLDVALAQSMYDAYVAAELAILNGQSYSIGSRSLTKANLHEVVAQRANWAMLLNRLTAKATGPRVFRAIPRDI